MKGLEGSPAGLQQLLERIPSKFSQDLKLMSLHSSRTRPDTAVLMAPKMAAVVANFMLAIDVEGPGVARGLMRGCDEGDSEKEMNIC